MTEGHEPLMLFTCRASYHLAQRICAHLRSYQNHHDVRLCEPDVIRFANENLKVKINESVRGADVFLVQTAANSSHAPRGVNPNKVSPEQAAKLSLSENLLELLITIDALRGASAGRVTVVAPHDQQSASRQPPPQRISAALPAGLRLGSGRSIPEAAHGPSPWA